MTKRELYESMKRVEREYLAARHLAERSLRRNDFAAEDFPIGLSLADVQSLEVALPATYLLRLFSKFEAGLRSIWVGHFGRLTRPDMKPLIDSIATRLTMPGTVRDGAHLVREARNAVIHVGDAALPMTWNEAHRRLRRFCAYAPLQW